MKTEKKKYLSNQFFSSPLKKVQWLFVFFCAAYNLLRIPKLREPCV